MTRPKLACTIAAIAILACAFTKANATSPQDGSQKAVVVKPAKAGWGKSSHAAPEPANRWFDPIDSVAKRIVRKTAVAEPIVKPAVAPKAVLKPSPAPAAVPKPAPKAAPVPTRPPSTYKPLPKIRWVQPEPAATVAKPPVNVPRRVAATQAAPAKTRCTSPACTTCNPRPVQPVVQTQCQCAECTPRATRTRRGWRGWRTSRKAKLEARRQAKLARTSRTSGRRRRRPQFVGSGVATTNPPQHQMHQAAEGSYHHRPFTHTDADEDAALWGEIAEVDGYTPYSNEFFTDLHNDFESSRRVDPALRPLIEAPFSLEPDPIEPPTPSHSVSAADFAPLDEVSAADFSQPRTTQREQLRQNDFPVETRIGVWKSGHQAASTGFTTRQ